MPEPLSLKIGLGMNVTVLPYWLATLLMIYLYFIMLSADLSSVSNRKSISALAGGGHFVVMAFDVHAAGLHLQHHLGAQVLEVVDRRNGEIAFLVARAVAQVVLLAAGVPAAFVGVDVVETVLRGGVETDAVEDEELRFGAEEGLVGDAGLDQIGFGFLGDVARVALVGLRGERIDGVADHHQGRRVAERIHEGGVGSGISNMSDSWIDCQPRIELASKPKPSLKESLFEFADRVADVLPDAGKVGETKIEHFRVVLCCEFKNPFRVHPFSLDKDVCRVHAEETRTRRR